MKKSLAFVMLGLGLGCAMHEKKAISTQVVTFPEGAIIQYNGTNAGRAPSPITLPQDANGRLTGHAEVLAIPNTYQSNLFAQMRIFDPLSRIDRVPEQIMIDMTLPGTNSPISAIAMTQPESEK